MPIELDEQFLRKLDRFQIVPHGVHHGGQIGQRRRAILCTRGDLALIILNRVPGHADGVPVAGQADPGGEVPGVVF